jgi:hypothetical protein
MPITDDSKNAIDILAEGSISDQLNDAPTDEPKVEEPKVDEKEAAREARFEKLERQLLESQQEAQFMRGYLQRQQAEQTRPQPEPEDKEEPLDYDGLTKDMETRGAKALHEFVDTQIEKRVQKALKEVDGRVNGRINQDRAVDGRRQAFANELNTCMSEFKDFWSDDTFKSEADVEAMKILSMRGGKTLADFQPGDLYSAASRVAARWERAGKGKTEEQPRNGSSIREISRRVPATDNLGNGNNGHRSAAPKAIDDLGMSDKEKMAAKNVFKKLKELNPGMNETKFVQYYQEGEAEREQ